MSAPDDKRLKELEAVNPRLEKLLAERTFEPVCPTSRTIILHAPVMAAVELLEGGHIGAGRAPRQANVVVDFRCLR